MSDHNLRALANHTKLRPMTFFSLLDAEIKTDKNYYVQFKTVNDLLRAIKQKIIDGRVWDNRKQEWVAAP